MKRTRPCPPIHPTTLVIGIDVAKEAHVAVATSADGRSAKPHRFPATREGFESMVAYATTAATKLAATSFVVALEPTGHYAETLVRWLEMQKVTTYSVQPGHTSKAKSLLDGSPRKTDPKDAEVIALLCRQGLARPYRSLTGPFAVLRVASHQRQQLVKQRSQVVNRLHRHVDCMFPELRKLFPKIESRTSLWVLSAMPTPAEVLTHSADELANALREVSRGQLREDRAAELLTAARSSVGITEALPAHRLAVRQLLSALKELLVQISEVEGVMLEALSEVSYASVLLSIPRLGKVTVATLLGEFGDLLDFKVAKQLVKFAGLSLVESSSGGHQGRHHIGRNGRAYARQMLYLAALRVGWGVFAEPRRRKVEDGKREPIKAAVANMARLLRVMHALVRDNKPFDGARFAPKEAPLAA